MNPADDAAVIGVAGLDRNGALAPVRSAHFITGVGRGGAGWGDGAR
jgi:hypothetical protein